MRFLFEIILTAIVFIFFWSIGIRLAKDCRHNQTIVIDLDTMTDIKPIIERGKIWCENNENGTLEQYLSEHLSEQQPIPKGIIRALKYQTLGYNLVFFTTLQDCLRIPMVAFLDTWKFKGQLWMAQPEYKHEVETDIVGYKIRCYEEFSALFNIVGRIDKMLGCTGICERRKAVKK